MKVRIIYDKKACIGAGECATLSKDLWKIAPDSKAILKDAKLNDKTGKYELVVDESLLNLQKKVSGSCPVNAIKIVVEN